MIMRVLIIVLLLALATLSLANPALDTLSRRADILKIYNNAPHTTFQISKGPNRDAKLSTAFYRTALVADPKKSTMHALLSESLYLHHGKVLKKMARPLNIPFSARQGGLTGDRCSTSIDCDVGRTCVDDVAGASRCIPTAGVQECTSDTECVTGEVCRTASTGSTFCVSQEFIDEFPPGPGGTTPAPTTPAPTTPATSGGFTGNLCTTDADCEGSRFCLDLSDGSSRCTPRDGPQSCTSDSDCVPEESCVPVDSRSFCFARTFEPTPPKGTPAPDPTTPINSPTGAPSPVPGGKGFTGNLCSTDADCKAPRTCFAFSDGSASRCAPPNLQNCGSDSDCVPEETCVTISTGSFCFSRTIEREPSPGPTGNPTPSQQPSNTLTPTNSPTLSPSPVPAPCIAVDSLQHLSTEQLVYERHRLARVLCDTNESCATAGHMVIYDGKGMMMKSYCELIGGCVTKTKHVNSPRYGKGLTVASKSDNMVFTAFSARYITRAEEGVLSFAIRIGL